MRSANRIVVAAAAALAVLCATTQAQVAIETVTVGNAGNAGELSGQGAGGYGQNRVCGGVSYVYQMGKYEVTAGQYTEFLNAVAATDTYGLYDPGMSATYGCGIQRSGTSGSYAYTIPDPNQANRPVNFVDWGDATRFANWLHNGRPTGPQDLSTTEDGSYFLNGATTDTELLAIGREPDAAWAITTEDEWYKAAYHKNDGVTGNYFNLPTSGDDMPSNDLIDPDPGNNATFYDNGHTIGSPYYRTEVGAHENSESPYSTFDQAGNVWEWNESKVYEAGGWHRCLRGGSFNVNDDAYALFASSRYYYRYPTHTNGSIGFRVVWLSPCLSPGDSGKLCTADFYPNNGDGVWDYSEDGNCIVDFHDLGKLLPNYGMTSGATREDGDIYPVSGGDGAVDIRDLGELLAQYGDDCN
jgi:sulfatase modifying factor 1